MKKLIQTRDVVKQFVPIYAKGHSLDVGAGTAKYKEIIKKAFPLIRQAMFMMAPRLTMLKILKI